MYENMNAQLEAWTHQRLNSMRREVGRENWLKSQRTRVQVTAWCKVLRAVGKELIEIGSWLTRIGTYQLETRN